MATNPLPAANQRARRTGTDFLNFARRCVEIVLAHPWGVDKDLFLYQYFGGAPPIDSATRNFEWEEFKRARDHSNAEFNENHEGWVWMRARHGNASGQFYYQAVARIAGGEPETVIQYPVSQALHVDKTGDWMTRTQSHMRVKVANIEAKKRAALLTGNKQLLSEAESELDEIIVLAPRLAAIYFDTGLTVQDLRQLAGSTRVPQMLLGSIKRTLQSYERSQREINRLSQLIYTLKQIRQGKRP